MYLRKWGLSVVGLLLASVMVVVAGCDRQQTRSSDGEEAIAVPGDDDFDDRGAEEESDAEEKHDEGEEPDDPGSAVPVELADEEDSPRHPALDECDDEPEDGSRSDCIAAAAVEADELSLQERSDFCEEAPQPFRCEYFFATAVDEAELCDRERFAAVTDYGPECFLLTSMAEGGDCDTGFLYEVWAEGRGRNVAGDSPRAAELCRALEPMGLPEDGDALEELLVRWYIERAEAYVTSTYCPPGPRSRAIENLRRAVGLDPSLADSIDEDFAERLGHRVAFYEITGVLDPATWEGLEEAMTSASFHGPSSVAHLPTSSLSFHDDGTYTYEKRITHSVDEPVEFETIEGEWSILSRQTEEGWALIDFDGEEYVFKRRELHITDHGPLQTYVFHPLDELENRGIAFDFSDLEYVGEC